MKKKEYDPKVYGVDGGYLLYLERWEKRFGDATRADYHFWHHGERIHAPVHRLSLDEYNSHTNKLKLWNNAFNRAYKREDEEGMDKALERAFQHEFALLV